MDDDLQATLDDLTAHLTSERQSWLFGAGISCRSGLPLMGPLTELVAAQFNGAGADLFKLVRAQLPDDCHIEHILSQLGDLIALAERSRDKIAHIADKTYTAEILRELHGEIRDKIRHIICRGYHPKSGDSPARIATAEERVVKIELHQDFIRNLFASRAKPGRTQLPVKFFTLNYDTLIEDALALERISYVDGFSGGGMAYWSPDTAYELTGAGGRAHAQVFKLHGSVDWHADALDGSVFRCRDDRCYPERSGNVLIYPQSTKYMAAQKDPFARLFEQFRTALTSSQPNVMAICGYSFGDEHVDLEIENAMARSDSKTVIVAFVEEQKKGEAFSLPIRLQSWLQEKSWRNRVFAATNRGIYHGSLENRCQPPKTFEWWTFQGVTEFLKDGPQQLNPTPPAIDEVTTEPANDPASV